MKRVHLAYISPHQSWSSKYQDRNLEEGPDLMQRPWRYISYFLAPHVLLSLLIEPTISSQGIASPIISWTVSYQSLIKKFTIVLSLSQSHRDIFFNGGSHLSDDFSDLDIKLVRTLEYSFYLMSFNPKAYTILLKYNITFKEIFPNVKYNIFYKGLHLFFISFRMFWIYCFKR